MSEMTLNDRYWNQIFEKYDILYHINKNGYFQISSDQIKEFREPRLMCKFDHRKNLPQLFSNNNLAILPITRGDYIISNFDAYHKLEIENIPVKKFSLPTYIQSLDINDIPSEAIALNCAFASGIIADFIEDNDILSTVSGRMGTDSFTFHIKEYGRDSLQRINVKNSQIEIDAAYEGISCLALIEAKMDLSEDFMIRQLYYPFRMWQSRLTKPVKSIFCIYSNGIYILYEYSFEVTENYNSLQLVKIQKYSIEDTMISAQDIQNVLNNVELISEPDIPFPQADKFERVINLCELISINELTRNDVTECYDFDVRQTDYYTDAARYLGLLDKFREENITFYKISEKCKNILKLKFKQRQLAYCNCILSHQAFNESLKMYFKHGVMPSTEQLVDIMKHSDLYRVESETTFLRRASTIKGWLNWIISLINE